MFNLRRLLATLILVAVLGLGIIIWRHLQQQSPLEVIEALPEQVDLSLEQLHYTQNEAGRRRWTLDAQKAEYRRDADLALLDDVRLTLFEISRFQEVTLTAEHGQLQQQQQQVEVWGNVVLVTDRGERLYTERLQYEGESQLLHTDEQVHLVGPRLEMTGTGLQINLATGQLALKEDVWMLLLPEERK